jgi:hypothetical protein
MTKGRRGVNLPWGIKVNIAELESPMVYVEVGQTGVLQRRAVKFVRTSSILVFLAFPLNVETFI